MDIINKNYQDEFNFDQSINNDRKRAKLNDNIIDEYLSIRNDDLFSRLIEKLSFSIIYIENILTKDWLDILFNSLNLYKLNFIIIRDNYDLERDPFIYFIKNLFLNFYDKKSKDESQINKQLSLQLFFYYFLKEKKIDKYQSLDSFLESYPNFRDLPNYSSSHNLVTLISYANCFDLLKILKKPNSNKGFFINIATLIVEGKFVKNITGGGQTLKANQVCTIFHQETGVLISSKKRKETKKYNENTVKNIISDKEVFVFPEDGNTNNSLSLWWNNFTIKKKFYNLPLRDRSISFP